jgi:multiple sugar transport system substrate-binding protein
MNKPILLSTLSILVFALSGCAGKEEAPNTETAQQPAKPLPPVTLKLYANQSISDADFNKLIVEPVKKKYPHITVENIIKTKNTLIQHVASGEQLDLITVYNGHIPSFMDLNIFEDITPLAKKMNFDLNRFEPQTLETMKAISEKPGELYGIPYNVQLNALYYNKEIFDRFGVEYPKDGMTWENAAALAKRVTRTQDGVQYRGLDPESVIRMMYPLSTAIVEAKTNRSLVMGEIYKKLFETTNMIYSIPGNKPANWNVNSNDAFMKDKTVAMFAAVNLFDKLAQAQEFNWDIAQYPSYKDKPNVYGMHDLHVITINRASKNKEDAMRVLEVLYSDEVQMLSTKTTGRVSPLKDPKYKSAFGSEMPVLKGKQVASIFKSKPALAPPFSIFYTKARDILGAKFKDYADGKKDANTALREADEEITKYVQENSK